MADIQFKSLPNQTAILTGDIIPFQKKINETDYTTSHIKKEDILTKENVGLANVDNTSDADKPVSTATQTALNLKLNSSSYTATDVKTKYESNANTNAYTDAEKSKLAGVAENANVGVVPNTAITGATKTKITYDSKGLVTTGEDATTADIADSLNKRYVTDAEKTVIGNTSGTNTGDQDLSGLALKTNVLEKDNTTSFTPSADYHPATKKYVDDNASSGSLTMYLGTLSQGSAITSAMINKKIMYINTASPFSVALPAGTYGDQLEIANKGGHTITLTNGGFQSNDSYNLLSAKTVTLNCQVENSWLIQSISDTVVYNGGY